MRTGFEREEGEVGWHRSQGIQEEPLGRVPWGWAEAATVLLSLQHPCPGPARPGGRVGLAIVIIQNVLLSADLCKCAHAFINKTNLFSEFILLRCDFSAWKY